MAKTYNKMLIDVNGKISNIVTEVQGDQNSRYLDINLFNNGIPIDLTGHTVRIYMRRPNTNPLEEFFNDGEITEATRGRCQFLLSTQALAKEGELEAQVSIWKGTEEILSTQVFKIMVTTNLRTNGSVESSNEYGALVVLFQNLYEAHDLMTTMVQNIGNPSDIAAQYNLATMWQAWEFLTDYMKTDLTNMIEQALANASVQGVLDKIGNTQDLIGVLSSGTVMGKENDILMNNSAKIVCRGYIGTKFTITHNLSYVTKEVEITEDSMQLSSEISVEFVGVPLGTYTITVDISNTVLDGIESIQEIPLVVDEIGKFFDFSYYFEVERFTSNGAYTFPEYTVYITAAGAGGGGGGGDTSGGRYGYGGGGGSGGRCIYMRSLKRDVGSIENIMIGIGGAGGGTAAKGKNGGATVIGSIITLAGGYGGNHGASNGSPAGVSAPSGGGAGGAYQQAGGDSILPKGKGGTSGSSKGGGGGGGFESGGAGGLNSSTSGKDGGIGAGGAGGGSGFAGGKGGNGIVIIYAGVQ